MYKISTEQNSFCKHSCRGLSLIEVFIAIAILMLAVIPIYRHSTRDAVQAIETEKIQQAEQILESIREELRAMPFRRFNKATEGTEEAGPFVLPSGFFPVTYDEVLEIQRTEKGFDFEGTWKYVVRAGEVSRDMVEVDLTVTWKRPGRLEPLRRDLSMLIVRP